MFLLSCCPNCNTWHKSEDYFKCSCGCETFTEKWIREHTEHPKHKEALEWLNNNKENEDGKNIE